MGENIMITKHKELGSTNIFLWGGVIFKYLNQIIYNERFIGKIVNG